MNEIEPRRKWPRRSAAIAGLGLLSLVVAAFAWNLTSLRGLPDIDDPFDVASFSTVNVRDEDNAFVLYRQADAEVPPLGRPTDQRLADGFRGGAGLPRREPRGPRRLETRDGAAVRARSSRRGN